MSLNKSRGGERKEEGFRSGGELELSVLVLRRKKYMLRNVCKIFGRVSLAHMLKALGLGFFFGLHYKQLPNTICSFRHSKQISFFCCTFYFDQTIHLKWNNEVCME